MAKPRSKVNREKRFEVELIDEAELGPWENDLQQFTQQRLAARSQEGTARSALNARLGAKVAALRETQNSMIPAQPEFTVSRQFMGPLPPVGLWVRLEVTAALVGLEGRTVHGMAFTLWDGRRLGIVPEKSRHSQWKWGPRNTWKATSIGFLSLYGQERLSVPVRTSHPLPRHFSLRP